MAVMPNELSNLNNWVEITSELEELGMEEGL